MISLQMTQPINIGNLSHNIVSVSGDASHRKDVLKMADFLDGHLRAVGVETKLVDLGKHTMDGEVLQLPPVILGRFGNDPEKKTVLVYGHFDVQPVKSIRNVPFKTVYAKLLPFFRQRNLTGGTLIHSHSW
jgi:acetylornithine deacetylase/succinyl-diaminopimelate desuccinylase-like protein